MLPVIERAGLLVTDIEILRLHYAETLKAWRERFLAHRDDAKRIYEPRFVRMWEFYLAASEMSFREQNLMVIQIQLTKRQDVVPMTRDYIVAEEARLRAAGAAPPAIAAGRRIAPLWSALLDPAVKKNRPFPPFNAACELRDNRTARTLLSCNACYATIRVCTDIQWPSLILQPASRSKHLHRAIVPLRTT